MSSLPAPSKRQAESSLHLSASQFRSYASCPLAWWLSRRLKPDSVSVQLVFGSAIHGALEACNKSRMEGRLFTLPDLVLAYYAAWDVKLDEHECVDFGEEGDVQAIHAKAEQMLAVYLSQSSRGTPVGAESRFEISLHPDLPPVIGYIDCIEVRRDDDGIERLHLVDYKTAGRAPSSTEALGTDQLVLYGIAAKQTGLVEYFHLPIALRYDVLTKTKSPSYISLPVSADEVMEQRLIARCRALWRGMQGNVIYPNPSWACAGCGYQRHCRVWPRRVADE